MFAESFRFMQFILHPLQSVATLLRAWSTGLPVRKLYEYDREFIDMIKEGNVKFYGSADEAMNDIMGGNVRSRHHQAVPKTDCGSLCA